MFKRWLTVSIILAAFALPCVGEEQKTVKLEEVVVTATKGEKKIEDVPVSASVVTKEEIEKRRVSFVDEALKYEAGVVQRRTKLADTMSRATLRGFSGGQRTLVLIDGMPLNDAYVGGAYLNNLPLGDIQKIEVIKGPLSSLYGGEAMGGVINIITQTPKKENFEVKSSVSDYNTYYHILNYGNKVGKMSFSINLEKRTSDGDRTDLATKKITPGTSTTNVTGWTKTTDSKGSSTYLIGDKGKNYWDQNQYSCKFVFALNPVSNLSFSYKGNNREYGYRDPQSYLIDTTTGRPVDSGRVELPGEGVMTISPRDFLSTWGKTKNNIYGLAYDTLVREIALKGRLNFIDSNRFYVSPETGANYHGGPGKLSKTSPNDALFGEVQVDIPLRETHLITTGLSYRDDSAKACDWKLSNWKDESSTGTGNPTYEIKGKARTIAFYTQGEVQPIEHLKLFLGARYDTWKNYDASLIDGTKSSRYVDKERTYFSPKIGLLYKPEFKKGLYKLDGIRASLGKAFRPPTIYELYRTWTGWGKTYESNPELSPETTESWEIGIDQHLGKIALSATYFQSNLKNLIYNKAITPTLLRRENAGEGEIKGFEFEAKMNLTPYLNLFGNYTYQDTEITSNPADLKTVGKDFTDVPEKMFNLGLSFHKNALDASCIYHWVAKRYATSDNTDVIEGVYGAWDKVKTVDLKVGYTLKENLGIAIAVDNLLNREYFQYYKAPGRTITFEARYKY